jgi:hypothetical protein
MTLTNTERNPQGNLAASLLRLAIGMIVGGGAMWFYWQNAHTLRWADGVALALALICILAALRLTAESFNPAVLAKRMDVEGETTPHEAREVRLQALMMGLLGVVIFYPPLATLNGWPAPVWTYLVIAAFVAVKLWYNWRMFKKGDEFFRARVRDGAFVTYLVGQTALLAYAGGERLGLLTPLTAWDIFVVFTALTILTPLFTMRAKTRA